VRDRVILGSALKFGALAAGDADIYPRIGPTHEWDTAAGHAILLSAGGRVETLEGAPLTYGKPDLLNPGFIALGRH
jgi:3'(2'), 5'-bisphosphate nucleotidase